MSIRTFLSSLSIAAALIAAPASAAIIYSNGTPNTDNGYSIGPGAGTYDTFAIDGGGTVHSVGFYFQNYTGITGWNGAISYAIDSNSGAVLSTGVGQNVTATQSSFDWCCRGGKAWLITFDLGADFVAAAGTTYRLNLFGAGGPSPWWVTSSQGQAFYLSSPAAVSSVPEPSSVALAGIALLGLGAARRRKQGSH